MGIASGMILLRVVGYDIIELLYSKFAEVHFQFVPFFGIDRVYDRSLFASFDQVRVVARALRKRDELVKDSPVPVYRTYEKDIGIY
jgi:hypothetical protein